MNLYISDLHFGHSNVINFDHRPFADVDEMDNCLIKLWNSRVSKDDEVYIVGDFCYRSAKSPDWYLRQLKGHKHLIIGNHDKALLDCPEALKYLESIEKMMHVADGDKHIVLCHYPLCDWYKAQHGSWQIYGHIHANKDEAYQYMKQFDHTLNAAACINNYTPASFNELIRNNKVFQEKDMNGGQVFIARDKKTGEEFAFTCEGLTDDYEIRLAKGTDGNITYKNVKFKIEL